MTLRLQFTKYEGLGNDFVVVDAPDGRVMDPERAVQLCDRHFGIGADGVLTVTPPRSESGRASMVVVNADGSRPEMCGNGLRCVALHLLNQDRADGESFVIDTDAGPRPCAVSRTSPDEAVVESDLGLAQHLGPYTAKLPGADVTFAKVSLGNPHLVAFDLDWSLQQIDEFAAQISAAVPGGSNVELARARPDGGIDLIVWERGVGRTLACGTGAAATAAAAVAEGRAKVREPIRIHLPGGALTLRVDEGGRVDVKGPARRVFAGWLETH